MGTGRGGDPAGGAAEGRAKLEALVEVMLLAATADGEFGEDERGHFLASVESLTDRTFVEGELAALVGRLEASVAREGRAGRIEDLRARLHDAASRKVALSMAARMMASDGIVRTSERELILELAEGLGIDPDDAADLVAENTRKGG